MSKGFLVATRDWVQSKLDVLNRNLENTPLCVEFTTNLAVSANNEVKTITVQTPNNITRDDYILSNVYVSYQYGTCVTTIRRYWFNADNTVSIEFTATIKDQIATGHIILTKKTLA